MVGECVEVAILDRGENMHLDAEVALGLLQRFPDAGTFSPHLVAERYLVIVKAPECHSGFSCSGLRHAIVRWSFRLAGSIANALAVFNLNGPNTPDFAKDADHTRGIATMHRTLSLSDIRK